MEPVHDNDDSLPSLLPAIEYIIYLQNQQAKQQEQLESLQREVKALQIMKEYVMWHQNALVGVSGCEVDEHCTVCIAVCGVACLKRYMYYSTYMYRVHH